MGAWNFMEPNLEWVLKHIEAIFTAARATPGRPASASTGDRSAFAAYQGADRTRRRGWRLTGGSGNVDGQAASNAKLPIATVDGEWLEDVRSRFAFRRLAKASTEATVGKWFKQARAMRSRPTSRSSSSRPTR